MRRLPPLDALRAFEAAARHLSFTRAADEIHVTQGAVSHRVRALEAELGVPLFRRLTRRLELTEAGEALALAVRRGLDEIAGALGALDRGGAPDGPLRVSVLPSFAARWLVPRLARFRARHPGIETRIAAESALADLHGGGADVAIRYGRGRYPGLDAEFLMGDAVLPACSPALLREFGPLDGAEAAARFPLLHDSTAETDGSGADWCNWFAHAGRPDLPCHAGQRLSNAVLALEAAAAGLGLALGRQSLVEEDLASGRLVAPLRLTAPTAFSYWLVSLPEGACAARVLAFRAWVLEEVQAFLAVADGRRSPPRLQLIG
jgi:LysR family glycine cleavage system transcriptional activator